MKISKDSKFDRWFESFLSSPGNRTFDVLRDAFLQCWTTARVNTLAADADKAVLFGALRQAADLLECRMNGADIADDEKEALALFRHILGHDYLAVSQFKRLRTGVSKAMLILEEMMGDTDSAGEDDSPEYRAFRRLHNAYHNIPLCPICETAHLKLRKDGMSQCKQCEGLWRADELE